jgi:hypothetical protein
LQQQDKQLLAQQVKHTDNYVNLQLDYNVDDIICYKKDPTQPNWKIVLPESTVDDTAKWFHLLDMYYIQSHSQQRHRGGLGILIPSLFSFKFLQF